MPTSPTPATAHPADLLRAAAKLLREEAARAHRASPSPWAVTDEHVVCCADGMIVADRSDTDHPAERGDLPYIALVHPGVGLALAAWLEREAEIWQVIDDAAAHPEETGLKVTVGASTHAEALAVARQLLGTTVAEDGAAEPDTDRRARYAAAIRETDGWVLDDGQHMIDAVMAVADAEQQELRDEMVRRTLMLQASRDRVAQLTASPAAPPAPADRAAVLNEVAAQYEQLLADIGADTAQDPRYWTGVQHVTLGLRRLADEAPVSAPLAAQLNTLADKWEKRGEYGDSSITDRARELRAVLADDAAAGVQPPTTSEAHPPSVEYIAEVLELDGAWEYLGAHADPAVAARRRASVTRRHPDAQTRTVRKTTTYTVEPEPAAPAVPEEPTWAGATELASDREIARASATGIVGYQQDQGRLLHCLAHKPAPASRWADFHEVGADDLDDGGICVHPRCGRDLLAAWNPTRAPEEPTR